MINGLATAQESNGRLLFSNSKEQKILELLQGPDLESSAQEAWQLISQAGNQAKKHEPSSKKTLLFDQKKEDRLLSALNSMQLSDPSKLFEQSTRLFELLTGPSTKETKEKPKTRKTTQKQRQTKPKQELEIAKPEKTKKTRTIKPKVAREKITFEAVPNSDLFYAHIPANREQGTPAQIKIININPNKLLPFLKSTVARLLPQISSHTRASDVERFLGVAAEGFTKALYTFKEGDFKTFVIVSIRGRLLAAIKKSGTIKKSATAIELYNWYKRLDDPSIVTAPDIRKELAHFEQVNNSASLSSPMGDENSELEDIVPAKPVKIQRSKLSKEFETIITKLFDGLSDLDKSLARLRFIDEMKPAEIQANHHPELTSPAIFGRINRAKKTIAQNALKNPQLGALLEKILKSPESKKRVMVTKPAKQSSGLPHAKRLEFVKGLLLKMAGDQKQITKLFDLIKLDTRERGVLLKYSGINCKAQSIPQLAKELEFSELYTKKLLGLAAKKVYAVTYE